MDETEQSCSPTMDHIASLPSDEVDFHGNNPAEPEGPAPYVSSDELTIQGFIPEQMHIIAESPELGSITKGCKFAPDGSCLITCTENNAMKTFNLPGHYWNGTIPEQSTLQETVSFREGGTIYDYQWYPLLNSWQPETCCLATTIKHGPVHLWNVEASEIVASYRMFDHVDELSSAYSIAFNPSGDKLYCGTDGILHVFDVANPGREYLHRDMKKTGFKGIFSTIAVNPAMPSIYAVGSYLRTVSVNCEPEGVPLCVLEGHSGGITHLAFHESGHFLASGARKDNLINIWDLRMPGETYAVLERVVDTHQKIHFQFFYDTLITGNTNGTISWLNLRTSENGEVRVSEDCANGVSVNSAVPLIAASTGQRHFHVVDDDEEISTRTQENKVKLLWFGNKTLADIPS